MDADFINWVENANRYYNTLVDRIVPGYPRGEAEELWKQLGYIDNNMVVGEIFHLWVIDGEHVKELEKKLPTKEAGLNVLFVESIKPYKERKVKILNGSHTCLVPVSYLSGIDTVRETIEDKQLNKFVLDFIFNEVVPTINIPREQMDSYANSVLERYGNPFVRHELMSIALNSVTKYKTRILPSVLQNLNDLNHFPDHALFSLASLIVFYRGVRGEETIRLADDQWALDMFKELWANFDGSKEACHRIASHVLGLEKHWEVDLTKFEGVLDYVSECIYEITSTSMREALAKMVK
jgi:tagaturonate reductase